MKKLAAILIILGAFFIPITVLSQPNGSSAYQLTFAKIAAVITGSNSSTTFLRGDGSWATPSGGGGGNATTISLSNITAGTLATTLALGTQTISSASGGTTWAVNTITLGGVGESGGFTSNFRWAWGAYNSGAQDNTKAGIFSDGSQVGLNAISGSTVYQAVAGNIIASVTGSGVSMTNATVNGTLTVNGTAITPNSVSLSNITSGTLAVPLAAGSQNITTTGNLSIGTVTSGIWSGTKIATASGGTGIDTSASTGIPHIASGTWTVSALGASDLPSTITPAIVTAASGNLLVKGGASAAGRVEVADRISVMTAGTPGSYTDPGAGGIYLDGGITFSGTSSFLNAGSGHFSVEAVGGADMSYFGYSALLGTQGNYEFSIGRSNAATVAWVDGAGFGNLTTNAPTGSSQQFRINNVEQAVINATGNYLGVASPATTATVGFPNIPVCAGTPTGVPTLRTGFVPMVYDSTNHKLWIYDGGAWKMAAFI